MFEIFSLSSLLAITVQLINYWNINFKYCYKLESDRYFWKFNNLYIPNNGSCIKFSELYDISLADNFLIMDTEVNKNEDKLPYRLSGAVKNSKIYKSLQTLFDIHHCENIDAFEITKFKLVSKSTNYDIADKLLKEMLSLNEDLKDSDNSELRKETDIIYFLEVIYTFCEINRG